MGETEEHDRALSARYRMPSATILVPTVCKHSFPATLDWSVARPGLPPLQVGDGVQLTECACFRPPQWWALPFLEEGSGRCVACVLVTPFYTRNRRRAHHSNLIIACGTFCSRVTCLATGIVCFCRKCVSPVVGAASVYRSSVGPPAVIRFHISSRAPRCSIGVSPRRGRRQPAVRAYCRADRPGGQRSSLAC